jgi:polysaccharide biosynthesis protein PslH
MKIGLLSPIRPHPQRSGTRIRLYHFCREFAARHQVFLADCEEGSACLDSGLERYCQDIVRFPDSSAPFIRRIAAQALMRPFTVAPHTARKVRDWLHGHDFDAVIAAKSLGFYYAFYAGIPRRALSVIDDGATAHLHYQGVATLARSPLKKIRSLFQAGKLKRVECAMMRGCDCVVTPSMVEAGYLRSLFGREKVVTTPNGVDAAYFGVRQWKEEGGNEVLFFGTFRFEPNVDAARYLIDHIAPLCPPHLTFCLVGEDPPSDLRDRAGRDPRIRVTGYVEDLRPYLERCLAAVIPLRIGTGTRLKVLHAMAAGCPVIASRVGAEGLDVVDGEEIVIADSAMAFARAITHVESDRTFARSIGAAGRKRVEQSYGWTTIVAEFERELDKRVLQKQKGATVDKHLSR